MDLRKIRKLIEIFNASNLGEIEVKSGDESIRLTRTVQPAVVSLPPVPNELDSAAVEQKLADNEWSVDSPMVGTFYAAASPEDSPFVRLGDQVEVGQPLCLIEAMKIYNQIDADREGSVTKILKQDGDPVEFGEALFILSQ